MAGSIGQIGASAQQTSARLSQSFNRTETVTRLAPANPEQE